MRTLCLPTTAVTAFDATRSITAGALNGAGTPSSSAAPAQLDAASTTPGGAAAGVVSPPPRSRRRSANEGSNTMRPLPPRSPALLAATVAVALVVGATQADAAPRNRTAAAHVKARGGRNNLTSKQGAKSGQFNKSRDLLLVFHDNKPDSDDIHSQAAIGTMLRDRRFRGVRYHAVQGTVGHQGGTQLDSTSLFNLAYGAGRWSDARGGGRGRALSAVASKAIAALDAGGNVWIAEAGQSDFSADLVHQIKSQRSGVNTKTRIHVVQHSKHNEDHTNPGDLSFVKSNTSYTKLGDGNSGSGRSPALSSKTNNAAHWAQALSMPGPASGYWRVAHKLARAAKSNPNIDAGGMDFSDAVEVLWIFGLSGSVKAANDDITGFFSQFGARAGAHPGGKRRVVGTQPVTNKALSRKQGRRQPATGSTRPRQVKKG
jgi:hypothetical protein